MKFKLLIMILALNLYSFEPLNIDEALQKLDASELTFSYGSTSLSPSFECYDEERRYKFSRDDLKDYVCKSELNTFKDNYFATLYALIVKENPNLKKQALKIAEQRIKESAKACIKEPNEKFNGVKLEVKQELSLIDSQVGCVGSFYLRDTSRLALMVYENDERLFKKIYSKEYRKFKKIFEETLEFMPTREVSLESGYKTGEGSHEKYEYFMNKYKTYLGDLHYDGSATTYDPAYVMLAQYGLIDKEGWLVLPKDRE